MPRNVRREIECLQRLHDLTASFEDLLQFLQSESLLDKIELKEVRLMTTDLERAKWLQQKLAALSQDREFQLLEYEWTILPVERIRITMVTNNGHREILAEV